MDEPRELRFNEEQYQMLLRCSKKQDMTEWNDWRRNNSHIQIELEGANLNGKWLEGAKLEYALLCCTHFEHAFLQKAHFQHANICESHLEYADLQDAHLENATILKSYFEHANFTGAYLNKAIITETHFDHANFEFSHLEHAKILKAYFNDTELNGIRMEFVELKNINLVNHNLKRIHLEHAYLRDVNLEGSDLREAHMEHAKLRIVNIKNVKLWEAHLENTILSQVNLCGTSFLFSTVNGITLFRDCVVNGKTDFRGVGLDNVRIDSNIKGLLQYNIRRINWEMWYKKHTRLQWIVRCFFNISDYGISTTRIINYFISLSLLFATIYWGFCVFSPPGLIYNINDPAISSSPKLFLLLRSVYFSIVTMTTLGFGDMYAEPSSWLGHVLLIFQVILGYVLLGAIVTRLGILFTSDGPIDKKKFSDNETVISKIKKRLIQAFEKSKEMYRRRIRINK